MHALHPRPDRPVSDAALLLVDPALTVLPPTVADALERPDETAAALTLLEPGPSAVSALGSLFASRLSDAGLMDALVAVERQLTSLQAKQQEFLAEIAHRDPDGELDTAVALTSRLRETRELMDAGRVSYVHGRILASATEHLSDAVTAKVQARVLRRAETQTPGEFRAAVRRAVARFDTRNEVERHREAFLDRAVICRPEHDGMASIWLRLAADGAATVMTALNACAVKIEAGDERTADQRRADAAVQIALAALDNPNLPTTHGLRPAVSLTMAESTLAGLDDQPAELNGGAPANEGVAGGGGYGPSPATSPPATPTACTRAAAVTPTGARSTTASPGPPERPGSRTCNPCANATTTSSTAADGKSRRNPTATTTGPRPPDTTTATDHPNYPPPQGKTHPQRTASRHRSEPPRDVAVPANGLVPAA